MSYKVDFGSIDLQLNVLILFFNLKCKQIFNETVLNKVSISGEELKFSMKCYHVARYRLFTKREKNYFSELLKKN